jgi:hypothetical protein
MTWLGLLLMLGVLIALFVAWDWIFCGGKYCRWLGGFWS